jgi:hypothetical protein
LSANGTASVAARRAEAITLGLVVAYALGALILASSQAPGPVWIVSHPLAGALCLAGAIPLSLKIIRLRIGLAGPPGAAWSQAFQHAKAEGWFGERLIGYLLLVLLLPVFFWSFAAWKSFIPVFFPFHWDPAFAVLDRRLHGDDPYRLLGFLDHPPITLLLDRAYFSWNYLLVVLVLWQGWLGTRASRGRFWLAFVLTWILLGTVLATVGSSAGPCFYQRVTGDPGPYRPLMDYLASVDGLGIFVAQNYLWSAHEAQRVVFGGGISAFPSLHIAIPVLAACAAWHRHRLAAWAFIAFAVLIWIGSIQLAWHYAVDGEASAILVPGIWWLSGRLAGTTALDPGT